MDMLKDVFAKVLGLPAEEITEATSPVTCSEWDSFNHLVLVAAIEKEMGVTLTIIDVKKMISFKDAQAIVSSKNGIA